MIIGDFEWDGNESVVLPETDATAVYREGDFLVIRQKDRMRDDEAVVIIPVRFAEIVAAAIRKAVSGDATGG
jgi:hypothetical protein